MEKIVRPDVVVGIDVGQTCSGVAYSIGPDWSDPRVINKWPSVDGWQPADKVATRVGYDKQSRELVSWGFQTTFDNKDIYAFEQFKLTLDADFDDSRGFSCDHARRFYRDYLSCLYREIHTFFEQSLPNWRLLRIEYSFSTPTTWKNPAMIASIENLIKQAGFGSTAYETVRMGLTEAEAAAIEATGKGYQPGDVFLVCDAGGGTTDINILRRAGVGSSMKLEPLDHVEGVPVGSTLIDYQLFQHIIPRLEMVASHLDGEPLHVADEMLKTRFQNIKHSFPLPLADHFYLDIKALSGSHTFPEAGIHNSKMKISRSMLQGIFDEQIVQIFELIDQRLADLRTSHPSVSVGFIILSGGLGSSPYLMQKLKDRYQGRNPPIYVHKVLEPQLVISRGLVRERTQQLGSGPAIGTEVFETRRCRNSYGVLVSVPFNETIHKREDSILDKATGERWINNAVDWLINRGSQMNAGQGYHKAYSMNLLEGHQYMERKVDVVMSGLPVSELPRTMSDSGCRQVAVVKFRLTDNDLEFKRVSVWKLKKKAHYVASFKFVVKLGHADLKFQIIGQNGVLSSDNDNLSIEFLDASAVGRGAPTALESPASPSRLGPPPLSLPDKQLPPKQTPPSNAANSSTGASSPTAPPRESSRSWGNGTRWG